MIKPKVPGQYDPKDTKARNRDIVMRWVEGMDAVSVGKRFDMTAEQVMEVVQSSAGKRMREDIRKQAIDATLERFDASAPANLEKLVYLRDFSSDEKLQRQAALDLLEFSSLKKREAAEGALGAELMKGIIRISREGGTPKEDKSSESAS